MPGYAVIAALHALLGTLALITFWSAAWMKKGSPRHRAIGKMFLLAMAAVIVSGVPMVVEFGVYRDKPATALFLAYLLAITANSCWLAWRAITDKRDWRVMTARIGWRLNLWLPLALGIAAIIVGVLKGATLFLGFGLIGPWLAYRMLRFARRGPTRSNWHVIQHYQAMLGAGVATHVAFLGIGMQPVWRWLKTATDVPPMLVELFPWFAPLAVALAAGVWLGRRYDRPRTPAAGAAVQKVTSGMAKG